LVDRNECLLKLEWFCRNMRRDTPNDEWLKLRDRAYAKCIKAVHATDGLRIPIFGGPDPELWDRVNSNYFSLNQRVQEGASADTIENLAQELRDSGPDDLDPDFCSTVAHCDVLKSLRTWMFAVLALAALTLLALALASVFLLVAVLPYQICAKATALGCHALTAGLLLLLATMGVYGFTTASLPVVDVVRSEALFFFLLPGGFEDFPMEPGSDAMVQVGSNSGFIARNSGPTAFSELGNSRAQSRLLQHRAGGEHATLSIDAGRTALESWAATTATTTEVSSAMGIPTSLWQGVLVSLTSNLLVAVATGDMSPFLMTLKGSISQAWGVAEIMLRRWVRHFGATLQEGQVGGKALLQKLMQGLPSVDGLSAAHEQICGTDGASCNGLQELLLLREEASNYTREARRSLGGLVGSVQNTTYGCQVMLRAVMQTWGDVKKPLERMFHRIKTVIEGGWQTITKMVDKELTDDLHALFDGIFIMLPKIVSAARVVVTQLLDIVRSTGPALATVGKALQLVQTYTVELLQRRKPEKVGAELPPLKLGIMQDTLMEAKKFFHADVEGDGSKRNSEMIELVSDEHNDFDGRLTTWRTSTFTARSPGARLQSPGLFQTIVPFVYGALKDPCTQIGMVFLHEIKHMSAGRGFRTQKELGMCSLQMPSACTSFGPAFLGLALLTTAFAAVRVGYALGCRSCAA
jgi:hypothetical protein